MDHLVTLYVLAIIYRPPPSQKNGLTADLFFKEFGIFLEKLVPTTQPLIILGDFNFHLDIATDYHAMKFLDTFNLIQFIKAPTHKDGHILDLVISRSNDAQIIQAALKPCARQTKVGVQDQRAQYSKKANHIT